jgi:Xaa-Pro aminopeptidase
LTEFAQRRQGVISTFGQAKIEALLVSSPASVRYLTDFSGSNGLLLLTRLDSHFFTDPRYAIEASQKLPDCRVHVAKRPLLEEAASIVKRKHLKKLGFEGSFVTVADLESLKKGLGRGTDLVRVAGLVESLRMVKSPTEIGKIRKSVQVNSEAYSRTLTRVRVGLKEQEIAAELDFQMRVLGAEKVAFETIVAAGPRTALPHARPGSHRLAPNELLLIDMGAVLDGYSSDMTRCAFLGSPPRQLRQLYNAVLEAQKAAIDTVRDGVLASKVDAAARNVLKGHKLDKAFIHSTGHGLGLEIHEAPRIAKREKLKLKAGMVITIEPGVYLEGTGGIRIEDTLLVTENGCQIMTPTPKEFIQL